MSSTGGGAVNAFGYFAKKKDLIEILTIQVNFRNIRCHL